MGDKKKRRNGNNRRGGNNKWRGGNNHRRDGNNHCRDGIKNRVGEWQQPPHWSADDSHGSTSQKLLRSISVIPSTIQPHLSASLSANLLFAPMKSVGRGWHVFSEYSYFASLRSKEETQQQKTTRLCTAVGQMLISQVLPSSKQNKTKQNLFAYAVVSAFSSWKNVS